LPKFSPIKARIASGSVHIARRDRLYCFLAVTSKPLLVSISVIGRERNAELC
jgi:hypothetical protein